MIDFIFVFVLGLFIGSFLNCVSCRVFLEEDFVIKNSYCPNCKHRLSALELIPVFSFLLLGGRCSHCKNKISWQYPLVEIATGLVFVAIYWSLGFNLLGTFTSYQVWSLIYYWTIFSFLIIAFIYDARHYIIPDRITFFGTIISLGWIAFSFYSNILSMENILPIIYSGVFASLFFFCLWFFSRGKAMGFGDVKLVFLLGLILGFPNIIVALFFAFTLGAFIGILLIAKGEKKMKSQVPFGPYLIAGTLFALIYGSDIVNWYWSFSLK
ncbi:MAG: prepilin peptidase [Candidatus Paceibacterota bacterium]|jgi:prepilin signal peptidase PulO-like enzyme (type II secretory pathway)|nr:prepilin peptidase [bacterium]